MKKRMIWIAMLGVALVAAAQETIVQYDFTYPGSGGANKSATTSHSDLSATTDFAGSNLTLEWHTVDGSTWTAWGGDGNTQFLGWQAKNLNSEGTFDITIKPGYQLSISSLSLATAKRFNGTSLAYQNLEGFYSTNGVNWVSLGTDSVVDNIAWNTQTFTPGTAPASLTGTVYFKISYGILNNYGYFRQDDITVHGAVTLQGPPPVLGTLYTVE